MSVFGLKRQRNNNDMQKVIVIGCPGSGKTVFSQKLHQLTGLPLIHLDFTYHRLKRETTNEMERKQTWRKWVTEQVVKPAWIIDGNYKSTFDIRMPAAHTIIYLDYPRSLSVLRTLRRRFQYHGKTRQDMPEGWREHISPTFLKFIWAYRKIERPKVLALLNDFKKEKKIYIFAHPSEAEQFLKSGITPIGTNP